MNGGGGGLMETGRADAAVALVEDALSKADGRSDHNIVYGRMLGTYGYAQMKKRDWAQARGTLERAASIVAPALDRSDEHTYELQSLMRISYAVFCLTKKYTIIERTYSQVNIIFQYIDLLSSTNI